MLIMTGTIMRNMLQRCNLSEKERREADRQIEINPFALRRTLDERYSGPFKNPIFQENQNPVSGLQDEKTSHLIVTSAGITIVEFCDYFNEELHHGVATKIPESLRTAGDSFTLGQAVSYGPLMSEFWNGDEPFSGVKTIGENDFLMFKVRGLQKQYL